jgi:acyl-coenzyme A thioesterase PaaI-like protein
MIPAFFWRSVPPAWQPLLLRLGLNWFPAYRATGARVAEISRDMKRVVVRLPLRRSTRNGAGTLFGGSLYSATDPIFALMLAVHLGPDYIVWDKAASIRYRRPGREALYAEFTVSDVEIDEVRRIIASEGACDRTFITRFVDREGVVHTEIEKTVYVASKQHYRKRRPAD